jgi:cell division septation protein DedD
MHLRACRDMKKKRQKKKRIHKQSLSRNIALLFLSLGLLAGVSILFTSFSTRSELSMDPIQSTVKGLVARDEKPLPATEPQPAKTEVKKSNAIPAFDYSFYKILKEKNSAEPIEEHYSVQIGAFKSQLHAKTLAQELREKSRIKCRIEKEGNLFCVRWGTFTTISTAEENRVKLSDKIKRNCRVVKM